MTASLTSERPGKRDRLIAGARETIHRQGVEATTLADIAEASDVPLGNIYYYFKSKDELVAAAIDARRLIPALGRAGGCREVLRAFSHLKSQLI